MSRCHWANTPNKLYVKYHDEEWGHPSHDDHYLFEMLILESFQAGLSWECILNKREAFRKSFDNFNVDKVASYQQDKIDSLMNNPQIVRNKLKIKASINNAQIFQQIKKEYGSFSNYIWHFTNNKVIYGNGMLVSSNKLSDTISQDLQSRGMKFVGSIIIYSYLQAIGIINDHELSCDYYKKSPNT